MNPRPERWARLVNPGSAAGVLALALLAAVAAAGADAGKKAATPTPKTITAVDLKGLLSQARGTATLVHVWATWCPPCREEFPSIVRFHEAYASHGIKLILVSADASGKRDPVVKFLAQQGVTFPSYIINNPDDAFIDTLCTNWTGTLPSSFFFGPEGGLRQWWEGPADYDRYQGEAEALLKPNKQTEARP